MKYLSMIHLYIKSMLCEIFTFFGGEYIYIYMRMTKFMKEKIALQT